MSGDKTLPSATPRNLYLEPSPYANDGGHMIGVTPSRLSRAELLALGGQTSPIKAIRAHCVECCGGVEAEARKCTAITCELWPYRMGKNVFHAQRKAAIQKAKPATAATVRASNPTASNVKLGGLSDG